MTMMQERDAGREAGLMHAIITRKPRRMSRVDHHSPDVFPMPT